MIPGWANGAGLGFGDRRIPKALSTAAVCAE